MIFHKPSLGSREVPHKTWARLVQPFWRLLDTKQTNRHPNKLNFCIDLSLFPITHVLYPSFLLNTINTILYFIFCFFPALNTTLSFISCSFPALNTILYFISCSFPTLNTILSFISCSFPTLNTILSFMSYSFPTLNTTFSFISCSFPALNTPHFFYILFLSNSEYHPFFRYVPFQL